MDALIHAAILGIVQGLTEFLPISSSAHLILVPYLFGWHDPFIDSAAFDVMLHMGTLIALLVYFWRDLIATPRRVARLDPRPADRRRPGAPARLAARDLGRSRRRILGAGLESFFDETFREHVSLIAIFIARRRRPPVARRAPRQPRPGPRPDAASATR